MKGAREEGRGKRETASVFDKFLEVVAHINFCILIHCKASHFQEKVY